MNDTEQNRRSGAKSPAHTLVLRERSRLDITGVNDIGAFDDMTVNLLTPEGDLSVEGSELRIERFDCASGDIVIEGKIDGIYYLADNKPAKKGAFSRLFK